MQNDQNNRETGARKLETGSPSSQQVSQEAAENRAPNDDFGLTEGETGVDHGDGTQPIEKVTGAGPAIARHSKDAQ